LTDNQAFEHEVNSRFDDANTKRKRVICLVALKDKITSKFIFEQCAFAM